MITLVARPTEFCYYWENPIKDFCINYSFKDYVSHLPQVLLKLMRDFPVVFTIATFSLLTIFFLLAYFGVKKIFILSKIKK